MSNDIGAVPKADRARRTSWLQINFVSVLVTLLGGTPPRTVCPLKSFASIVLTFSPGQHIYDVMGCAWNMPANYDPGLFESCDADSGEPMGVYGGSTFHQGDAATPQPHAIPSSSNCKNEPTIANGAATPATTTVTGSGKASSSGVSQSSVRKFH